jgi:hypothetical protein
MRVAARCGDGDASMGENVILSALRTRHLRVVGGCLSVAHLPLISLALSLVEFDGAGFDVFDALVKEMGVWGQPRVLHDKFEVSTALRIWLQHDAQ